MSDLPQWPDLDPEVKAQMKQELLETIAQKEKLRESLIITTLSLPVMEGDSLHDYAEELLRLARTILGVEEYGLKPIQLEQIIIGGVGGMTDEGMGMLPWYIETRHLSEKDEAAFTRASEGFDESLRKGDHTVGPTDEGDSPS